MITVYRTFQCQIVLASEASDEQSSLEATATIMKSRLSHFYILHSKNKCKYFKKVTTRFELVISCLLGRRFNQLSHATATPLKLILNKMFKTFSYHHHQFFRHVTLSISIGFTGPSIAQLVERWTVEGCRYP